MTDTWVREEAQRQLADCDVPTDGVDRQLAESCLRAALAHQAEAIRELRAALAVDVGNGPQCRGCYAYLAEARQAHGRLLGCAAARPLPRGAEP